MVLAIINVLYEKCGFTLGGSTYVALMISRVWQEVSRAFSVASMYGVEKDPFTSKSSSPKTMISLSLTTNLSFCVR